MFEYFGDVKPDVYLSDERISHIKEGRREDYEKIKDFMKSAIEQPHQIYEDHKNPQTAFFIGRTLDSSVNVIVKLAYSKDLHDRSFIVTAHPAGENTMKRIKKNNRCLYNSDDS